MTLDFNLSIYSTQQSREDANMVIVSRFIDTQEPTIVSLRTSTTRKRLPTTHRYAFGARTWRWNLQACTLS
jgi:hypothetical protein